MCRGRIGGHTMDKKGFAYSTKPLTFNIVREFYKFSVTFPSQHLAGTVGQTHCRQSRKKETLKASRE